MKIRHLLGWMIAAAAIISCKPDDIEEIDPEANAVSFSVKYGEMTEGVAKPESVHYHANTHILHLIPYFILKV